MKNNAHRRTLASGAAIGLLGLTSLAVATPASAADETSTVSSTVRWSPSPADLSKFGPNGGTISFTLTPSYVEGSAQEVRACGYDPEQIVPTTVSFEVSDLRPTDAYAGNPDLTYTMADGTLKASTVTMAPGQERVYYGYQRTVGDLVKNTSYDQAHTVPGTQALNPTVTEVDGKLTTPDWLAPTETFLGSFVAAAVTTVTPQEGVELPSFVELEAAPTFRLSAGEMKGYTPSYLYYSVGGAIVSPIEEVAYSGQPTQAYWYVANPYGASDASVEIGAAITARSITGTVSCEREAAGGALIDPVIGSVGLGTAAVLAGAGLLHRRRQTAV
ncbi:hypothetical protein [Cellulosimicrobium sp. NPDC057862]|uniref:hypothetical protein n=1 Tax=Cellulosimicrobium sp. NPDC057862 TaxID=3346266 RepID=UPI00366F4D6C